MNQPFGTFHDIDSAAGRLLLDASGAAAIIEAGTGTGHPEFVKGELAALTRALCLLIDAPLYRGGTYGLMTGSAVWRELFDRVSAIVRQTHTWFSVKAEDMTRLAAEWPDLRNQLLSGGKENKA